MVSSRYLVIPFLVQVLLMAGDELHFHRQRKLPRWERLGHPLDTLTVVLCFGWLLFLPPTPLTVIIYVGLCIFSCLFITKDERMHHTHCRAGEHWLHAMLFIMHPLVLLCAGLIWPAIHETRQTLFNFLQYEGIERLFLVGNLILTLGFGAYQLIYWNFIWQPPSMTK